jgi:hypothetical protein
MAASGLIGRGLLNLPSPVVALMPLMMLAAFIGIRAYWKRV